MKSPQEIYNKIGKNSLYNLLLKFFSFPLWLILPLIILRYIGVEGYGVWAFIQVFVNYGGMLNIGIDTTVTKFTAEYKAREDHQRVVQIFNTFLVIYSILFIIFFIAVFIYQDWIIDVFIKTDKISRGDISFALILYAITFAVKNITKVYPSFFTGLERMDLTNKVDMLSITCNFIFSFAFLYLGWGIKGLAIASALSTLINVFTYVWVCAKVTPYMKLNPFLFSFDILYEVYRYIGYGAVGGIAAITHFQLNKIIVSYFLGLKYLTYFDLGHRLTSAILGFFSSFITPILPAASGVYASSGLEKLREVFETTFKYIAMMSTPIFLFTSTFSGWIIFVWLGAGYEETAFVLRFLSIAYLINVLTGPGAAILTGMGFPEIPFYASVVAAVINVTLSLILVVKLGLTGIIISDLSAYIVGSVYGFCYLQKKLGISSMDILKHLKFPFFTSMGILIILSLISIMSFIVHLNNYYIELTSAAILFFISYALLVYKNPEYARVRDFIRRPFFLFTYRD